ncbi:MAG: dihydroorotase family protein [Desulfurococcaceae archaeon]
MRETILLKNVKIPLNNEIVEGNILIENGLIKTLSKLEAEADIVLNGEGLPAVPGGIDIHAHVYDPQYPEHEDWKTGSQAALFGCITTLIDMPLRTIVDKISVLEEKINEARRRSYVNFGFTGGFILDNNIDAIDQLVHMGIKTFKVFTCSPFKTSEEFLPQILEKARINNVVIIVHAEDENLLNYLKKFHREDNILSFHLSRSSYAEASAITRIGYIALETQARIHIAHVSSREGVEAIEFLKKKNCCITAETCPHYLYFTREDAVKFGNYLKVTPSLKTNIDRETLWMGLKKGIIDIYASDNAPSPRELKEKDVWNAWSGIPCLEIMGPFLYTYGVKRDLINIFDYIRVFSENPAKLLGLYPYIGSLKPGSIADIVVLDTRNPKRVSAKTHHHKVDWTPWENMVLWGYPWIVLVNGYVVIDKNELIDKPGEKIFINELIAKQNIIY